MVNWGFQTISHEAFNPLAKLFLNNSKKGILDSLIMDYLTERGLAYWFMDDGGKLDYNKNSKNHSVVLNTHSFTKLEVENMSFELSQKFDLECSIRNNKGKQIIVINSNSFNNFINLIEPYLIRNIAQEGDIVLCLGAGSITYWAATLAAQIDTIGLQESSIVYEQVG